jgi:hypothetical protein
VKLRHCGAKHHQGDYWKEEYGRQPDPYQRSCSEALVLPSLVTPPVIHPPGATRRTVTGSKPLVKHRPGQTAAIGYQHNFGSRERETHREIAKACRNICRRGPYLPSRQLPVQVG